MAYKDSSEIKSNQSYTLGEYSFRIERSSVPGSTNDKFEAICTKDGKNARKSIQLPSSTKFYGYYVEANDTTADVYAVVEVESEEGDGERTSSLDVSPFEHSVPTGTFAEYDGRDGEDPKSKSYTISNGSLVMLLDNRYEIPDWLVIAATPDSSTKLEEVYTIWQGSTTTLYPVQDSFTYNGKTAYIITVYAGVGVPGTPSGNYVLVDLSEDTQIRNIAWTMLYGSLVDPVYETKTMLIGRFAIELEDAGGVGPGSDWVDPGDYDPDWEEGDPTHTLYVNVTGALSGRHNDPIVDPSYSYIPADKDTVKDYGCGGDGGHGGGGGAGASTVVIHKFATNQANSKEVTAIARRHGYGSGGGKGGKGGDGCILVYY